ncbi:MAG: hypothetical protein AB9866_08440 [Syntrophobacteraceae bacterium]
MPPENWVSFLKAKCCSASAFLRDVLYGMTVHEMDIELRKEKSQVNSLFMLIVFGDLMGLPLLPPYYSMRLLPYIVPNIQTWKRQLLRERDITDLASNL